MGSYFTPPLSALTNHHISIKGSKWIALKKFEDTFKHAKTVLVEIFEKCIPKAYHTGATEVGMGQRRIVNLTPAVILACLIHMYGWPLLTKLDQALT